MNDTPNIQKHFTYQKQPQEFTIDEITTILWTKDMGHRMAIARMKRIADQSEIAEALGVTQATLSKLETGKVRVCELVTIAKLRKVFEHEFNYIFFAKGAIRYNEAVIKKTYWDTRLRQRRKNKSPYSKSRIL